MMNPLWRPSCGEFDIGRDGGELERSTRLACILLLPLSSHRHVASTDMGGPAGHPIVEFVAIADVNGDPGLGFASWPKRLSGLDP